MSRRIVPAFVLLPLVAVLLLAAGVALSAGPRSDRADVASGPSPTTATVRAADASAAGEHPASGKRSGYDDASAETRAMQDDDASNPGFLWVAQGKALWEASAGSSGQSCAGCHGDAPASMRGVAARYPMVDPALGRPITLEGRIQQCRTDRQGAPALPAESDALLGLAAYVGLQSRGMTIAIIGDAPARPFLELGRQVFETRMGQLNLSCAQCHDGLAGQKLAGSTIPQAHPNGYPLYRLEWQGMGSLGRRLRNCLTGVRAEPFAADAPELSALSLYLAWRSNGMKVETPAVRP